MPGEGPIHSESQKHNKKLLAGKKVMNYKGLQLVILDLFTGNIKLDFNANIQRKTKASEDGQPLYKMKVKFVSSFGPGQRSAAEPIPTPSPLEYFIPIIISLNRLTELEPKLPSWCRR